MTPKWTKPTRDQVQLALSSLTDTNLRILFFSELKNPEWLSHLRDLEVFATTPEPWIDEKGIQRALPWPEGEYLLRVAADRPEDVTALLLAQGSSKNPWVQRIIIGGALAVPEGEAAKLVPAIVNIVKGATDWIDAREVVQVAERMGDSARPSQMRRLLTALFEPQTGPDELTALGTRRSVRASIESYYYSELLPRVVSRLAGLGMAGVKLVAGWVMRAAQISSAEGESAGDRTSHIWRPSISAHEQNSGLREIDDTLIDTLRDVAIEVAAGGTLVETVNLLNGSRLFVIRRIGVEVASQVIARGPVTGDVQLGLELLSDPSLMQLSARPEYVRLARAALPLLSPTETDAWVAAVRESQWQGSDAEIRRMAAWPSDDPDQVSTADVEATRRQMLYRFLVPLEDVIPGQLSAEYAEMKREYGVIGHAEFGSYTQSFTGPVSPLTQTELGEMSAAALSNYLRTWQPSEREQFLGPTVEGLSREIEALATSKPLLVDAIAGELFALGRSYVRAALTGWAKAVASGYRPSEQVWALLLAVSQAVDDSQDDTGDFESGDSAWRYAQRAAIDLLAANIKAIEGTLEAADAARIWKVLASLTEHPDPTEEHEVRFGGSNMDPLTLSLNTTRPAALRAATLLLTRSGDGAAPTGLQQEILTTLARHVGPSNDPSLAVAAVMGESVGRIWAVDRGWLSSKADVFFAILDPSDEIRAWADVVVSVALRVYRTSSTFLEIIRPALESILGSEYQDFEHIDGWRGHNSTAQAAATHIVNAFIVGLLELDDSLIQQLFSGGVPRAAISETLGHFGWSAMHSADKGEIPSPEILARARQLIDSRATEIRAGMADPAELSGFYWWARSGVFEPSWWLPILLLATESPEFTSGGMLGEALERAVTTEPDLTMRVFSTILPRGEDWQSYDLIQHAPKILAGALTSGIETAVSAAREALDRLGRDGHFATLRDVDTLLGAGAEPNDS